MRKTKSILRATLAGLCLLALTACTASKPANNDIEQISYHEARNFFLNQGQELAVGQKITNDKDFDKYFGLAAFMGKGGEPTRVDFANRHHRRISKRQRLGYQPPLQGEGGRKARFLHPSHHVARCRQGIQRCTGGGKPVIRFVTHVIRIVRTLHLGHRAIPILL